MKSQDINKLISQKMKDMEIVPDNSKRKGSVDNLGSTRRSTLELPQLRKKYSDTTSRDTELSSDSSSEISDHDVTVKLVRPKDRNQDNEPGDNERTVIFKDGNILGSQG